MTSTLRILIVHLATIATLLFQVNCQSFIQIDTSPNIVQSKNASIRLGFALSKPLIKGNWFRIYFPIGEITVSESVTNCRENDNIIGITQCFANHEENYLEMQFNKNIDLETSISPVFTVLMDKAVHLPMTVKITEDINMKTQNGEAKSTRFEATIGNITSVELKPVSNVVGEDTILKVKIVTGNDIPARGKIVIQANEFWNQGSIEAQQEYFNSITCDSFNYISSNKIETVGQFQCVLLQNPTQVVIEGAFDEGYVPAGSIIEFSVNGFKNPIQSKKLFSIFDVFTSGFNLANRVDQKLRNSVKVDEPAKLLDVSFYVPSGQSAIVQTKSVLMLGFNSPVPFRKTCKVSYHFPTAFYDVSQITEIRTGALFSTQPESYTPVTFEIKEEDNGYKSVNFQSCPVFRKQGVPETSRISGLTLPLTIEPTKSIRIYVRDASNDVIVYEDTGASMIPQAGKVLSLTPSVEPTTVSALAYFTVKVTAQHNLYSTQSPTIKIKFPDEFQVQEKCEMPASCTSNLHENSLSASEIIKDTLTAGTTITFKIGPVKLYHSTAIIEEFFTVETFMKSMLDSENQYLVDSLIQAHKIELTSGSFKEFNVKFSNQQSNVKSDMTISFIADHSIPQYGNIVVQYPSQITLNDVFFSQSNCKDWQKFSSNSGVCQIYPSNNTIIVTKGFMQSASKESDTISFTIPRVTNPPTLDSTNTFKLRTTDQYFSTIDELKKEYTVKMLKPPQLKSAKATIGNQENSIFTNYTFEMVTETFITNSQQATFTFPITLLVGPDPVCNLTSSANIAVETPCQVVDSNKLKIDLKNILVINPTETFQIEVKMIKNPPSTQATDKISVEFIETSTGKTTNQDLNSLFVQTSIPFQIKVADASLDRSNLLAGQASTYSLRMKLSHNIEVGGGVIIHYPPQVQVKNQQLQVTVDASQYVPGLILTKPSIDFSARQIIFLEDSFTQKIIAEPSTQKELVITIKDLVNPMTNEASSSFEIVTFNQFNNILYLIDEIATGLEIMNSCNFPCKSCVSTNPNFCTSCDNEATLSFLEEGTCLDKCSEGFYLEKNESHKSCYKCDSTCLTCSGTANNCTSCGIIGFNHLRINECVDECGPGYINDPSNHMCLKCKETCSECSRSTDNCTKCDLNGKTPLWFNFDCLSKCPSDISVEVNNICRDCSSNCKTCAGKIDSCTTCQSYNRLDIFTKKCVDACKPDLQVYRSDTGYCHNCDPQCKTCSDRTNFCTSCNNDLLLNMGGTCGNKCEVDSSGRFQTTMNGVCSHCKLPCKTCEKDKLSTCKSCIDELPLLFNTTCVDHCPDKYEPNNQTINQCILVGLICPEGFHLNDGGDGCVPNTFLCEEGYEINSQNTACIPKAGTTVPFPFLFMSFCTTLAVTYSKLKESSNTRVTTSLILFYGAFEVLQYLLMGIYAARLEWYGAAALSFVGFFFMIATNIGFFIMYKKSILQDSAYKNWIRIQGKTKTLIPLLCLFVNFKIIRYVYSGFYGLENTQAVFKNPQHTIHRPLKFVTYFQFVFVYIPIFIADVLIFFQGKWDQSTVLAIETFVLQMAIILLTTLEFMDPDLYQEDEIIYSPLKMKGMMAVVQDEQIHEKQLLRLENDSYKIEILLRRKALTEMVKQVRHNFNVARKQIDIGGDIPKVFTKFDQQQIMKKRAFSMVDLQGLTENSEVTHDGTRSSSSEDSEEDYVFKRRYSFPLETHLQDILDPMWENQIEQIRSSLLNQKFKNNCYAEAKPEQSAAQKAVQRRKKLISRRTQTYLKELLMLDGEELVDSDMEIIMEEDIEIDDKYTRAIIDGVISDGFSASENEEDELNKPQTKKKTVKDSEIIAKVSKTGKRPDFQLQDIMGQFEIDDAGNYIILRNENGKLQDKNGNIVNKRGYLIDRAGNIINKRHELIFKVAELDEDGEIPAPMGFDMRKQNLLNLQNQDNIDEMIDKITQEMIPLSKQQLKTHESQMNSDSFQVRSKKQLSKNRIQKSLPPARSLMALKDRLPDNQSNDLCFLPQYINSIQTDEKDIRKALGSVEDILKNQKYYQHPQFNIEVLDETWPKKTVKSGFYHPNEMSANKSNMSHDIADFMNEGLLKRPGKSNARTGGDHSNTNVKRVKKNSQTRILSGDPRLKNLEAIYLKKFGHSNSSMNMKFKQLNNTGLIAPKPQFSNFRPEEINVDMSSFRDQRQVQAAREIDAMEKEYLSNSVVQGSPVNVNNSQMAIYSNQQFRANNQLFFDNEQE